MTISGECPFCRPEMASICLWQSAHYRIIADQYPRCVGHILLLSKSHLPSHMRAPSDYLPELEAAQVPARQFLLDNFGKASFWENGGSLFQEVPHAHLHALPVTLCLPADWLAEKMLKSLGSWEAVWQECQQIDPYCYVETGDQRYLLQRADQYATLLNEARSQLVAQNAFELQPETGDIKRHGIEMMDETIRLWKIWAGA